MYGVHATYNYHSTHNAPTDGIIAAFDSRADALALIETLYECRQWDDRTVIHKPGEWASPNYKIVGVRPTQEWREWQANYKAHPDQYYFA